MHESKSRGTSPDVDSRGGEGIKVDEGRLGWVKSPIRAENGASGCRCSALPRCGVLHALCLPKLVGLDSKALADGDELVSGLAEDVEGVRDNVVDCGVVHAVE